MNLKNFENKESDRCYNYGINRIIDNISIMLFMF